MPPEDERPPDDQLADFFMLAMGRMLALPETHDVSFDDVEFALIVRLPQAEGSELGPRFIFMRSFEGQDEFEEMLAQARLNVSMWDLDPTHVEFTPFDLTHRSPFEQG